MKMPAHLKTAAGRRAYTASFRKLMVKVMHLLGEDDHAIAEALGVSVRTVANARREAGLAVNRKSRGPTDDMH